jgi:hypothetical protein
MVDELLLLFDEEKDERLSSDATSTASEKVESFA